MHPETRIILTMLRNRPYQVLWISMPVFMVFSLFGLNSTFDIQIHDTYYVIASFHVGIVSSIIAGLLGAIYWLISTRRLISWMTVFHIMGTMLGFFLFYALFSGFAVDLHPHNMDIRYYELLNLIAALPIWIWIVSQLFFLANISIGLLRT